jgi:hypothetical protein
MKAETKTALINVLCAAAVAFAAFMIYSNTLGHGFLFNERNIVESMNAKNAAGGFRSFAAECF